MFFADFSDEEKAKKTVTHSIDTSNGRYVAWIHNCCGFKHSILGAHTEEAQPISVGDLDNHFEFQHYLKIVQNL